MPVGVVGMGLMGTSIAACLLGAGHSVTGIEIDEVKRKTAHKRVLALLKQSKNEGLLRADPKTVVERLTVSEEYSSFAKAHIVIEAVSEDLQIKKQVIRKVEEAVSSGALIGTNTSAIPVTILQQGAIHPGRVLGIHWAEPAHITRFMEIICGNESLPENAERARAMAERWGKEPSIVRRDIRGFITNRCFYALLREAFHLVESGYATIEDVDRSLRNDLGYWITFAGPFRFMDLTGVPAYAAVMKDLFPELSCNTAVPAPMKKVVESGAKGTSSSNGFYEYAPGEAEGWEKEFLKFSYEIRKLAVKYSEDRVKSLKKSRTRP